jgi:hypothetical protein
MEGWMPSPRMCGRKETTQCLSEGVENRFKEFAMHTTNVARHHGPREKHPF